jgi:hypothetical protein
MKTTFHLGFSAYGLKQTSYKNQRCQAYFAVLTLAAAMFMRPAQSATTRAVTNFFDIGPGCLRQLIAESGPGDTITMAAGFQTITLTNGPLVIGRDLTILNTSGLRVQVSGNHTSRVFSVIGGSVTLSNLAIIEGGVQGANGYAGSGHGMTVTDGEMGESTEGGGIRNSAALTLLNCLVEDNQAIGGRGGDFHGNGAGGGAGYGGHGKGGGIYNSGTLNLTNCVFAHNIGEGGAGGTAYAGEQLEGGTGGDGGAALYNEVGGVIQAVGCTFDSNEGSGGPGGTISGENNTPGSGIGGAGGRGCGVILNLGELTCANCTFTGNQGIGGLDGGGQGYQSRGGTGVGAIGNAGNFSSVNNTICSNLAIRTDPAALEVNCHGGLQTYGAGSSSLINTLIANNSGASTADVAGPVSSLGHNFVGIADGSSGWIAGSDLTGTASSRWDPALGPLMPIRRADESDAYVHRIGPASSAYNAGDNAVWDPPYNLKTDQVGHKRVLGPRVDIGAYEYKAENIWFGPAGELIQPWTLVQAVSAAFTADSIHFTTNLPGALVCDEVIVDKSIDIVGPGAAVLTLSGDGSNRVFHVTSNATVNISGLTIANGIGTSGGGILNEGTLQVSDCLIASNQASSFGGFGGGIYSSGTLTVSGSTFLSNNAAFGGGLANAGVLSVFNSTFASNSAVSKGGALFQFGSSALLRNCTVAGNAAFDGGGGLGCDIGSALPDVQNCLVAGNIGFVPDAYGIFNSLGYNLIGLADPSYTVGFGTNDDQLGTPSSPIDALLGSLQDNGGPTPTMALLPDSPAINRGYSPSLLLDQRGGHRPVYATLKLAAGDGSDIGAYERDGLLRITAIDRLAPTGINLSFWSELGSSYGIEQSPTLWPGSWTSLTDNVVGAGGVVQVADPDSMQPRRFYRVRLLP